MTRPNFLVFCTDQQSGLSLGINGNPDVRTPNIDRIGREGVTFTRAYCPNPVCTPSRATLITGLTCRQHGSLSNGTPLREDVPTVTGLLAANGYRTHAVGKIHLQCFIGDEPHLEGRNPAFSWEDRYLWRTRRITKLPSPYYGFQSVDFTRGHVSSVHGPYQFWLEDAHPGAYELLGRDRALGTTESIRDCWRMAIPQELHYNTWTADRTIDFLDRAGDDEPFFLWCSFPDPHQPYAACRPYSEMYDPAALTPYPTWQAEGDPCGFLAERRRRHHARAAGSGQGFDEASLREAMAQTYGMISHVDACVGRVLEKLEARGLAENTVVAFVSDHGEYLGGHHLLRKDVWPYEPLWRVPLLWRAPSARPRGACGAVVGLIDFVPTVLDYAGLSPSLMDMRGYGRADRPTLPGRSLRPVIEGGESLPDRPALIEYDCDGEPGPMIRLRSMVFRDHKLTVFGGTGQGVLFDLADDPHETVNRWDDPACAPVKADLLARWVDETARTDRLDVRRISGA